MSNWAQEYLIKQAMEKIAKRWFWRLASLTPARRLRALEQIQKSFPNLVLGPDLRPESVRWGTLAEIGRSLNPRREISDAAWNRTADRLVDSLQKKTPPQELPWTPHWTKKYPQLAGLLRFGPTSFAVAPKSHLKSPYLFSNNPSPASALPADPARYVYRGTGESALGELKSNFASGYPQVALGYSMGDSAPVLLQIKTPKDSLFTPHLRLFEREERSVALQKWKKGKLKASGRDESGKLPFYETVLEQEPLSQDVRVHRVLKPLFDFRQYPPSQLLEGLIPAMRDVQLLRGKRMTPELRGRIERAQAAWDRPVMTGLPEGFKP